MDLQGDTEALILHEVAKAHEVQPEGEPHFTEARPGHSTSDILNDAPDVPDDCQNQNPLKTSSLPYINHYGDASGDPAKDIAQILRGEDDTSIYSGCQGKTRVLRIQQETESMLKDTKSRTTDDDGSYPLRETYNHLSEVDRLFEENTDTDPMEITY
jgi:hypothetical protein